MNEQTNLSPNPLFTVDYPDGRIFTVELIVVDTLTTRHARGATWDVGRTHVQIVLAGEEVHDHECDEPDRYTGSIVDQAVIAAGAMPHAQRDKLHADIHKWLCECRGEAATRDHEAD